MLFAYRSCSARRFMSGCSAPSSSLETFIMRKLIGLSILLVPGCITPQYKKDVVRQQAAFDLGCPQPRVQIVTLGNDQYGAVGCGAQLTYAIACLPQERTSCAARIVPGEGTAAQAGAHGPRQGAATPSAPTTTPGLPPTPPPQSPPRGGPSSSPSPTSEPTMPPPLARPTPSLPPASPVPGAAVPKTAPGP